MVSLVIEHADDRDMMIFPARDRNSRGIARRRTAALGADQQRAGETTPVLQRDAHAVCIALHDRRTGRHQQRDALGRSSRLAQADAQVTVLHHHAERAVRLKIGREGEQPACALFAHLDALDRAGLGSEVSDHTDRLHHPPRRARHRRGTAIGAGVADRLRRGGIDDDAGDTALRQRRRQRAADQPGPQDDDVGTLDIGHGETLSSPPL